MGACGGPIRPSPTGPCATISAFWAKALERDFFRRTSKCLYCRHPSFCPFSVRGLQRGDGDRLCEALDLALARSLQHRPGGLLCGEGGGRQVQPRLREGVSRLGARISGRSDLGHRSDRPGPDRPHPHRVEGVVRRELRGCGAGGGRRGYRILDGGWRDPSPNLATSSSKSCRRRTVSSTREMTYQMDVTDVIEGFAGGLGADN